MFPKAPIKRYYDNVSSGPGPWTYDPKLDECKVGVVPLGGQSSSRFSEGGNSSSTPGPGDYFISSSVTPRQPLARSHSRPNLSTRIPMPSSVKTSLDSSLFKTPPPPAAKGNKGIQSLIRRSGSASHLDDRVKERKDEVDALKLRVQKMDSNYDKVLQEKKTLETEKEELQSRFKEINLDLAFTLTEKLTLEDKCTSLEKEFKAFEAESETKKSLMNELTEKLESQTKKALDYERLLIENVTKLEEWDRLMTEMKSEKEELEMKKSSLEGSLSALKDELSSFQLENAAEKESLLAKISERESAIEEFIESKRDLNETCLILEERLKEAESQIEDYKTAESLHLELKSVNEELSQALADMEAKYLEKLNIIAELEKEIETLKKDNTVLEDEKGEIKKKIDECNRDWKDNYESLLLRFEDSEALSKKLKRELSDRSQRLIKAEETAREDPGSKAKVKLLNDMISSLKKELEEANTRLAEKSTESDEYARQYEALKTMIAPFRDQLEQYELEKTALLSQNKEAQGEIKKVAEALGQKLGHQNHKQKIQIMVRLKQENVDLKLALRKAEAEVAHLKKKLSFSENDPLVEQHKMDKLSVTRKPARFASPLRLSNRNVNN